MSILKCRHCANATHRKLIVILVALATTLITQFPLNLYAHEHTQTHRRLTLAAVEFLEADFFSHACAVGADTNCSAKGLTKTQIEKELAQGAIDEDECINLDAHGMPWEFHPNWNSHFFDPTGKLHPADVFSPAANPVDCTFIGPSATFTQTTAAARAGQLWTIAENEYKAGNYLRTYRVLGRVMHLLEDMASPAHAHIDPHGQANLFDCGGDSDDFERWGYCDGVASHILDYFRFDTEPNSEPNKLAITAYREPKFQDLCGGVAPPPGMTCRMWNSMTKLYNGKPQGGTGSLDPVIKKAGEENLGTAYVRRVAQVVYDFTTYRVKLKDDTIKTDLQVDSELRRMLRGSGFVDCGAGVEDKGLCDVIGGWTISGRALYSGDYQQIGRTLFACGSQEGVGDTKEEWWLMKHGCSKRTTRDQACVWNFITRRYVCTDIPGPQALNNFLDGYAYIENTGGEGPAGLARPIDNFIPLRFGCGPGEGKLCGDVSAATGPKSKPMFRKLYGTTSNQEDVPGSSKGKTLNRIYGDVLYPTAVAYGAGMIQSFVSANTVLVAEAGGPYEGCVSIMFDAGGSSTPNASITSYEWDFENDGIFDVASNQVLTEHVYTAAFTGQARLKITDSSDVMAEDTADVTITGITLPVITEITAEPGHLWPPNHEMIPVTLAPILEGVCGKLQRCQITDVNVTPSLGSDDKLDWEIIGDLSVLLRAAGILDDQTQREYDITVVCDSAVGSATRHVTVQVGNLDNEETTLEIDDSANNSNQDTGSSGLSLPTLLFFSMIFVLRRKFY